MKMFVFAFFALAALVSADRGPYIRKVATTSGILSGKHSSAHGNPLTIFYGVPYAQPPVDDLRFKHPVALDTPSVERDATKFAPSCMQPEHVPTVINPLLHPNRAELSEDCLYLNVYVPSRGDDFGSLPVMVWLAGEGFDYADPQQFDVENLAAEGRVIVVTVNYRLSVFGFLATISEEAPGNAGLFDQRMALKWVKANINKFGGNAENVTLFGRLTGSISAAIHAFSPLSMQEKLFNRAIFQSGFPVGEWVFEKSPLNNTFALAEAMGCLYSEISDIVDCLKRQTPELLLTTAMGIPQKWRPVYDFSLIYENTFKAVTKFNYAPVDVMIGSNNDEGSLCVIALNAMKSLFYEKIVENTLQKEDMKEMVEENMKAFYKVDDDFLNKLARYNYRRQGGDIRDEFVSFCGEMYISARGQRLADLLAGKNSNVFVYEFQHRPSFSINPAFIRAGHGDDVLYSLGLPFHIQDLSQDESRLTKQMITYFTNFARYGNPNGIDNNKVWPRYTTDDRKILAINTHNVKAVTTTNEDSVYFWHELIPEAKKQEDRCPEQLAASASLVSISEDGEKQTRIFGKQITVPSAEYTVMGLLGVSGILFMTAIVMFYQAKKVAAFHRLN